MRFLGPPLVALALAYQGPAPQASRAPEELPSPSTIEELTTAIEAILAEHGVPGAGIALVTRDEVVWTGGVGKADPIAGIDVTAETHFRVASISKTFTALAIMQLVDAGKLDLSDRLRDLVPEIEFRNKWADTHPLLVAHLLEHTAGFDNQRSNEEHNYFDPPDIALLDVLKLNPRSRVARWPPGTRTSYSSHGYTLAGYIVEKLSGQTFEDYVRQHIFMPIGMATSDFQFDASNVANLALGFGDARLEPVVSYPVYMRPAWNLHTSAGELALFVRMLLNRGVAEGVRVATEEAVSTMEQEPMLTARTLRGRGVSLPAKPYPIRMLGHSGLMPGYRSRFEYSPEHGFGLVVLLNRYDSTQAFRALRDLLFRYLSRGLEFPPPPKASADVSTLRPLAGYYRVKNPRNRWEGRGGWPPVTVFVEGETLYEKERGQEPEPLVPLAGGSFRLSDEWRATRVFYRTEDGTQVFLRGTAYLEREGIWWVDGLWDFVVPLAAVLAALTTLLFGLLWVPRWALGRMREVPLLSARAAPLLATVALFLALGVQLSAPLGSMTRPGPFPVASLVLGWAFGALALAGLVLCVRSRRQEMNRWVWWHSTVVSTLLAAFFVHLWIARDVGVRPWVW